MNKLFLAIGVLFLIGVVLFLASRHFPAEKEPRATLNMLSKEDIDVINISRSKYQQFPGPSDAEVIDVAEILLRAKPLKDDIKKLLGEPSSTHIFEEPVANRHNSLEYWAYDIGDSRRMEIDFNSNGDITSISGVDVGFDILTLKDRKVIEKELGGDVVNKNESENK